MQVLCAEKHGFPGVLLLTASGDVWTNLEFFPQPTWLRLLVSGAVLFLLWLLYRLRVMQLAHRIRSRVERLQNERERNARMLHDTLLQDVQGLILRFQAVAERIPDGEEERAEFEAALVAADDVVARARDLAYGQRIDDMADLCASLAEIVATTPLDPHVQVRLVVEGKARALNPHIAAEITRIVREALLNIAEHAQAPAAEIAVGFEASHLAIRVRDYGVGIAEHMLALAHTGKDGHFGMIGMCERADRIGGNLTICSSPGEGSEITLTLPAKLAFSGPMRRRDWISRLVESSMRDRP